MINQHFYIARLIARYLSDEIEEEEQAELTTKAISVKSSGR